MNLNERVSLFENELNYFSNTSIRDFAIYCLGKLPEYFFHVPASASGKYHPAFALGEGGLVRHTKAAMYICDGLLNAGVASYYPNEMGFNPDEFGDSCMLALLLHDGYKLGRVNDNDAEALQGEAHTVHDHPLIASTFLVGQLSFFMEEHDINAYDVAIIHKAAQAITTHMGRYTTSAHSSIVLPSPMSGDWLHKFVHICDLLASRKQLDFQF